MTRPSRHASALFVTLAATGLALLGWRLWPDPQAPQTDFVLIDGRTLSSEQLRGSPVLINFWATSCPSCIAEMPDLARLQREFGARGLTIIGVAMPYDPPDQVVAFARGRQLPFAIALDLDARLTRDFGQVRLTPTNILIDKDWRIRTRSSGRLDLDRTRQQVEQLLEES
jgi:thiol-disulfide isomerase/thioredoxin